MKTIFFFSAIGTLGLVQSCHGGVPDVGPLGDSLQGYALYEPVRTNWGPGFVFTGEVKNGKIKNVEEICPSLYGESPVTEAGVFLPDYSGASNTDINIGLSMLESVIGKDNTAKINLAKYKDNKSVVVKWSSINEVSIPRSMGWMESGEPRKIKKQCFSVIEDLKARGEFEGRTFIITRAIKASSIDYNFDRAIDGDAGVELKFKELFDANAGGKWTSTGKTSLKVTSDVFVGYKTPKLLKDWVPTGLVAGEIATVSLEDSDLVIE